MSRKLAKPDLGGGISHPARYSDAMLALFAELLPPVEYPTVLDPFAGTGRIHELPNATAGIEIEPKWAALHDDTIEGDALLVMAMMRRSFDAIATSPTFGNRLADHHHASDPESRRSYTHDLGEELQEGNSGAMQWGEEYRELHAHAWQLAVALLRGGGRFLLHSKDHVRGGTMQPVTLWHTATLCSCGMRFTDAIPIDARGLRMGANADLRGPEWVLVLDKL
jgi:hypothetical protein